MKRSIPLILIVIVIALLAWPSTVSADRTPTPPPGWSGSYSVVSPNEQYVLGLLSGTYEPPGKDVSPEINEANKLLLKYPTSGLYRNDGSITLLWPMQYISWQQRITLSSDGHHMVVWGEWPRDYGALALSFFADGNLLRSYSVQELVTYPEELPHSVSHYQWLFDHKLDDERGLLSIETHNHEKYVFGLSTGGVLSKAIPTAAVGEHANKRNRVTAAAMSTSIPKPEVEREPAPLPQEDYTMAMGLVVSAGSLAALFTGVSVLSGRARRKREREWRAIPVALPLRLKSRVRGRKVASRRVGGKM